MNDKQVDYKNKIKLYESLGAKKFKKVVMSIEKLRWSVTKKFFPNYLTYYEKLSKNNLNKALAKATSQEEKTAIINHYRRQILIARREFNREENRNYHMNLKRPTEIIQYLEYNKNVHKNGLINNMIIAFIASGFIISGIGIGIAATVIGLQALSALKNWQCINLQNYNICRLQVHKKALEQREAQRQKSNSTKYGEAANVVQKAFDNTREPSKIPTVSEIVAAIDNPEQLRQMKSWIESVKSTHVAKVEETNFGKGAK